MTGDDTELDQLAFRALTTFWDGEEPSPPDFGEGWSLQETRPTHPEGKLMFAEWTRPRRQSEAL